MPVARTRRYEHRSKTSCARMSAPAGFLDSAADAVTSAATSEPDEDATLAARPLAEGPGSRIGLYKLLQVIGQGGMGAVFMAEQDKPVRRRVALKVIKAGMDSAQVVARFEAERQALALMDHPNIAKVFEAGTTDSGRPFFVMELVKGIPITQYCDEARLSPRERLDMFIRVCQAIQHSHQKGIIHRDVKPSNVLVTLIDGEPVPKVIDFGIAKATDLRLTEKTLFTQFGSIVGTLEYMSPEQADLSGLDVDTRSDVFSLGVLLYELLTGTTPLERERLREAGYAEILRRIKEEEPPKPSTRLSGSGDRLASIAAVRGTEPARLTRAVRGDLDWIVMKALEKSRTRRYETANDFARDVQRDLDGDPVEACPPSAGYRFRKFVGKHRGAIATASAFAGLLIAGAGISIAMAVLAARAERAAAWSATVPSPRSPRQRPRGRSRAARPRSHRLYSSSSRNRCWPRRGRRGRRGAGSGRDNPQGRRRCPVQDRRRVQGPADHRGIDPGCARLDVLVPGRAIAGDPPAPRALDLRTSSLGPDHYNTLESRNNLAQSYVDAGRTADAIALHEENLRQCTTKLGPDHPDTLISRNNLAMAYHFAGRTDEAIALVQETLRLQTVKLGPEHPSTLITRNNLAQDYVASGQLAKAISLHQEILKIRTAKQGPDHPDTLTSRNNLALVYCYAGRTVEAIALDQETLRLRAAKLGGDHPLTLQSRNNLAQAYLAANRTAEAIALQEENLRMTIIKQGYDHPDTLNSRYNLALAYNAAGSFAKSEPILRECLARREKNQRDSWSTFDTRSQLSGSLLGQQKFAEAEPLLLQGYMGMKDREAKIPAQWKKNLPEAAQRVVRLYDSWGKKDKAAEWRAKLEKPPVSSDRLP